MAKERKLTERQKRFVEEYIVDCNATQAAIRAGYSKDYANGNISQILKNDLVKAALEKRMAEKDDELIAKQDEVLRYLTSVMRREQKEHVVVTVSEEKYDYIAGADGKPKSVRTKKEHVEVKEIPAKLSDANKAAELLGKRYSLFTDRVELDADMELNVKIDYGEGGGKS